MKLTILGSGTAIPVEHRGPTGSWIATSAASVLVDCGSGVLQKLHRAGGDIRTLDAVLLTHAHLDHLTDLLVLLFALRQLGGERDKPLRIYHSRPLEKVLRGLEEVFGHWLVPTSPPVRTFAVAPGAAFRVGDVSIRPFAVAHHESSLGYRIQASSSGAVLAVTGDTGLCPSLIEAARGVDALLVECSTTDEGAVAGHLCPADLLALLREAGPKAAILTHFYPEAEAADVVSAVRTLSPCPVWEARDGLAFEITHAGAAPTTLGRERAASPPAAEGGEARREEPVVFPDEVQVPRSGAADAEDPATIRAMMEAHLAELDGDDWSRRKYADGAADDAPARPARRSRRRWTAESLRALQPRREQLELLQRAGDPARLPVVNLRGQLRDAAMVQVRSAIQTWIATGQAYGRIVTGKGKRSEDGPVIKVTVLEWLEGDEARRWVRGWAPEITRDGDFGSLLIELRR